MSDTNVTEATLASCYMVYSFNHRKIFALKDCVDDSEGVETSHHLKMMASTARGTDQNFNLCGGRQGGHMAKEAAVKNNLCILSKS